MFGSFVASTFAGIACGLRCRRFNQSNKVQSRDLSDCDNRLSEVNCKSQKETVLCIEKVPQCR